MKKLFLIIPIAYIMASCGGCSTSSPEGVSACACDYSDKLKDAAVDNDLDEMMEVMKEFQEFQDEVDQKIEEGVYTEREIDEAIDASECDL